MERFGITAAQRKQFYENVIQCIQHQIKASALLAQQNVASCIRYYRFEQEKTENGGTEIYLETDYLRPLSDTLLSEATDEMEAINIAFRLATILRDLWKDPHKMTLRVLDPNELYITADSKIVLGGLHYAASPFLPEPPPFLPFVAPNIRSDVRNGVVGDCGADMYSLACMTWNLFSGNPLDAGLPERIRVFPQYATEELASTLMLGRHGDPQKTAEFRRMLNKCRTECSRRTDAPASIPIRKQQRKEYSIITV